jgi:hypothetical protein
MKAEGSHIHIHKIQTLDPILSKINPVQPDIKMILKKYIRNIKWIQNGV